MNLELLGDIKAVDTGVKLCRAKAQLLGLDAAKESIIENSVSQELRFFLGEIKLAFDTPTYMKILNVIAEKTKEDLAKEEDENYF